jgi:hypothetical protein
MMMMMIIGFDGFQNGRKARGLVSGGRAIEVFFIVCH